VQIRAVDMQKLGAVKPRTFLNQRCPEHDAGRAPVSSDDALGYEAGGAKSIQESESPRDLDGVRRHLDSGADDAERGSALEDVGGHAATRESTGERQPANTGADDGDAHLLHELEIKGPSSQMNSFQTAIGLLLSAGLRRNSRRILFGSSQIHPGAVRSSILQRKVRCGRELSNEE